MQLFLSIELAVAKDNTIIMSITKSCLGVSRSEEDVHDVHAVYVLLAKKKNNKTASETFLNAVFDKR